jgi:hypothetical protein
MNAIYDKAGGVSAMDGLVLFEANGIAVTMTPEAAIGVAKMLLTAGYEASGQALLAAGESSS